MAKPKPREPGDIVLWIHKWVGHGTDPIKLSEDELALFEKWAARQSRPVIRNEAGELTIMGHPLRLPKKMVKKVSL